MRYLVTGGTGFVGSHLVDALLARGDAVTALVRDPNRLRWLEGRDVRLAPGDTARGVGLEAALDDADAVIHVAGVIKARTEAEFLEGNAEATRKLLTAAARSKRPLKSVVVVTSLAACGPCPEGRRTREADPLKPVSAYGRSKAAAEAACAEFAGRVPVVIARPPVVYGPRDEAVLEIFRIVAWHLKPLPRPDQTLSIIHVRDLAAGLIAAAERGQPGRAYFLAHADSLTARQLADHVEEAAGAPALAVGIPAGLLHAAAAASQALSGGRAMFNRDKAVEMTAEGWACDPSASEEALGWKARIGHVDGLIETGKWYREKGWI